MKNKKIILAIISIILIMVLTTVSLASNNTRTGMTFDEAVQASKERNNKVKNEMSVSNENIVTNETTSTFTQNEVAEEKESTNTIVEDKEDTPISDEEEEQNSKENTDENESKVEDEDSKKFENNKNEKVEEGIVSFKETISEDIVKIGDNIEYKKVNVDGNVHIIAENIVLEDFEVDGNLFVTATNVELNNVIIEGSSYIAAKTVKLDGQVSFAYIIADSVLIEPYSNIIKELRVVSSNFEFEGIIGRDLYVCSENVNITDRAEIYGDCIVESANVEFSEDAKINGKKNIQIVENISESFTISNQDVYSQMITNCIIILIVSIFVLYSSPKFVAVNSELKLRSFVKAFFTGVLELIFVFIIFVILSYIGYGFGFGFALLILSMILVYFGKMLFIISAGIRLAGKSENISKIKSFFMILIVLALVEAINLLQLTGMIGILATIIINLVLGITGFGSFVRVVLTPPRKKKQVKVNTNKNKNSNNIREVRPEDFVMKGIPVELKEKVSEVKETTITKIKNETLDIEREKEKVVEENSKKEDTEISEDIEKIKDEEKEDKK